jgi:hypothetical protein
MKTSNLILANITCKTILNNEVTTIPNSSVKTLQMTGSIKRGREVTVIARLKISQKKQVKKNATNFIHDHHSKTSFKHIINDDKKFIYFSLQLLVDP